MSYLNDYGPNCPMSPDAEEIARIRSAMDGLKHKGTHGRVYGGDEDLIHIKDGERGAMGEQMAVALDSMIRAEALTNGMKTGEEIAMQSLCPGCYMVVLYDAAVIMATENGQDMKELGRSVANIFARLAATGDSSSVEEIDVITDEQLAATPNIAGFILPNMESM